VSFPGDLALDLEKILGSSCRRKIIKFLWRNGETNIMGIVTGVNSTYSQVNPSVHFLAGEEIVLDRRIGRMRLIKLVCDNPRTILLLQALKILDTGSDPRKKLSLRTLKVEGAIPIVDPSPVIPIFQEKPQSKNGRDPR